jgi:hypothetical protein
LLPGVKLMGAKVFVVHALCLRQGDESDAHLSKFGREDCPN